MAKNLKDLYKKISNLKDISPSEDVNSLFTQLVKFAISNKKDHGLNLQEIKNLRKICSKAEYALELHWANKIINSNNSSKEMLNFSYYNNYLELAYLEVSSLKTCKIHTDHKKALFIGGGPLPLTAIVFAHIHGFNISVLDSDKKAVKVSRDLIKCLNLQDKISIIQSSAEEFDKYKEFDVIFVASLVGGSMKEKKEILKRINNLSKKGTHVLARSVYGNRKLLYPLLNPQCYSMYKPIVEIRPLNEIINSVIVLRSTQKTI